MESSSTRRDGGRADRGQRADHPIRPPGRLFARMWALTGEQGRGRDEHAALRDRRRQILQDAEGLRPAVRLEIASTPTISSKVAEEVSGQDLGYFFIQWIESSGAPEFKLEYTIFRTQKGFRVMGKISQDLDTFRMPVDLQDRDRRQSRGEARRGGGHVLGILAWTPSASRRTSCIDPDNQVLRYRPADARGGGHPARRAVCRAERVRRSAEGISEGAGDQRATVRWRTTAWPRSTSCRTTGSPPPTSSAKR